MQAVASSSSNALLDQILTRVATLTGASSDAAIARELGAGRSSPATWRARGTIPWSSLVEFANARRVSLDWLVSGLGAQTRDMVSDDPERYSSIPLIDVRASAGPGAIAGTELVSDELNFKREWIHNKLHATPTDLRLIHVSGDSMEPDLRPGDLILVNVHDRTAIRDGIYVLRIGDALLVKRLQRLPDRIIVSSTNRNYPPFDMPKEPDGVAVIGRVVWVGREI